MATITSNLGDGLGIFTNGDQRCILGALNFENLYFVWTGDNCRLWGLANKYCIFGCLYFQKYFWVQFCQAGISVNTVFHYYHIVLNFWQMNRVQEMEMYFLVGFLSVAKWGEK